MGYDIHITRKNDWADSDGDEIDLEEWLAYLQSDSSMRLDGFAETPAGGDGTLRVESAGLAVWLDYSSDGVNGNKAWFGFRKRGEVVVKNPDLEILCKMHQIAQALDARVQGDDGEEYDEHGNEIGQNSKPGRPWWRFWQ